MEQLNKEKIQEFIGFLREKPQIEWTSSSIQDGCLSLPYPKYPKWVHDLIETFPCDRKYDEKIERIGKEKIQIDSYNLEQVIAHITYIIRRERFCDGLIASNIEDRTLLKLFEKLLTLL